MLVTHERDKLIQAIIFFTTKTRHCGKIKLYKLLYFLDFEHFKVTGRSVTGLEYFAWPKGPVPKALHEEIDAPRDDMASAIRFGERRVGEDRKPMLVVDPLIPFSDRHFSRRESRIMDDLATEYHNAKWQQMVEVTHLENKPWDVVYVQQGRKQALIPYELAIRPDEAEDVARVARDWQETMDSLR